MEPGDKVEIVVVFGNSFIVMKTTVYLLYDKPIGEKVEQYHAPDKNVVVGDENECAAKRVSLQVEPIDDTKLRQKRRKL
jgi:hypothetical protein